MLVLRAQHRKTSSDLLLWHHLASSLFLESLIKASSSGLPTDFFFCINSVNILLNHIICFCSGPITHREQLLMIVYHHRGGSCCTIDYNLPNSFFWLWEITLSALCIVFFPRLASCNYIFWPDSGLKVAIDLGVLVTRAELALLSP